MDIEKSKSGNPIIRYEGRERDIEPVAGNERNIQEIGTHIEHTIGPIETVVHELVSDLVHIDIHIIEPCDEQPFHTLITSGMSDLPMNAPEGMDEWARAELLVHLPAIWPLNEEALKNENNYWPIRWLKTIARLPHEYESWVGQFHTIPNGDPAEPYAGNTRFNCLMLVPPYRLGEDFFRLNSSKGYPIWFFNLCPLYEEEVQYKLDNGAEALLKLFEEKDIPIDIVDNDRQNAFGSNRKKKRFGLF
jgi:hypothetical protein